MLKLLIKRLFFVLGVMLTGPFIVITLLEGLLFGRLSERIFAACKEILAVAPTPAGQYLRGGFYWAVCRNISPDVSFLLGSMVAHRDVTIGRNVAVGCYSIVGMAEIGDNVLLGARVSILSGKYTHGKPDERANHDQIDPEYSTIKIGKNSWIGEGAIILAHVGENCTVSAGSVVLRDVPDNTTVMGNPARKASLG